MNFENQMPAAEKEPRFPSLEEVRYQIKRMTERFGHKNAKEERIFAEGKEVHLYELSAVDEKGDAYLYLYQRKGEYEHSKAAATVIEVTYYMGRLEDGMCVGGDILSHYDESSGEWTDTK
jgi:hypothetical protein